MELTEPVKEYLSTTAAELKGSDRRLFMARTVRLLGSGGQRRAERELGWNRVTISKGMHELTSGIRCVDYFSGRGRKRAEELLPNLLGDIRAIVDGQCQTDPTFQTQRLYTRLTASEVRNQLLRKGYLDADLPTVETIRQKMHQLGYHLRKVAKCQPKKKVPETDEIFDWLGDVNPAADESDDVLRLSLDAKATVKIGLFSRGGRNWVEVKASDHDFKADATLTLFGILLPRYGDLFLYFSCSALTSDFIVDVLEHCWEGQRHRFPKVRTLLINQDNGPENQSRRTQFMKRMVGFGSTQDIEVRLAYYPPYHSKYNAIERCWGALEQHWNGALLDSIPTALRFAQTMTWKSKHPLVELISKTYDKGVRLTKQEMAALETQIERLPGLEKWFVSIPRRRPLV
jgi:Rhodopirellula transposase DDE domain